MCLVLLELLLGEMYTKGIVVTYINVCMPSVQTTLTSQSADQTLEANTTQVILTCAATTDPGTRLTWAWTRDKRPIDFYEVGFHTVILNKLTDISLW